MATSAHPVPSTGAVRRSVTPRRRAEPPELVDVFRPDDRRLGLGRRWEDWRRDAEPAIERRGFDVFRS